MRTLRGLLAIGICALVVAATAASARAQDDDVVDDQAAPDEAPADLGAPAPEGEPPPAPDGDQPPTDGDQAPPTDGDQAPPPDGDQPPPPPDGAAAPAAEEYPPEALALLPRELLEQLPAAVTRFLRPEYWTQLKQACPQPTPDEVLACLQAPEGSALFETLHARGVVASMLERMDVMLPTVLSGEDLDTLGALCDEPGEAWGNCVFEKSLEDPACEAPEEALAQCVVSNDDVTEVYLEIADQKKAAFGDELYVGFAGLLAVLDLDTIKAVRAACPQTDADEAVDCLLANELVKAIVTVYAELAQAVVAEAEKEIVAAGNTIDAAAYTEQVLLLFLSLPSHTVGSLASECEKLHPELATVTDTTVLDRGLACITEAADTDPIANPAYISKERLREWLGIARTKVIGQIRAKEEAAQGKAFDRIVIVLVVLGGLGFVGVMLMPVFLGRRYPGQSGLLWKSSAVAAMTFAVTVALLGGALLAVRTVQGKVGTDSTSPKMRVAEGAFSVLARTEYIELFSEVSRERLDLIKKPLRAVVKATANPEEFAVFAAYLATHWADLLDEPELRNAARNAKKLKGQAESFKAVFKFYKKVDWVMGLVPIVLALLAVVLYVIPLKDTLVDIASAPARAAKAGAAEGGTTAKAMRLVWAEVKATLPFIGLILVLLPVTGIFLSRAVEPLLELLISGALRTFEYLWMADASTAVLYLSLGTTILLLVVCLAVYILAVAFFLGTARKALRAVFHGGKGFGEFRGLWTWGVASTLWALVLPFAFLLGIRFLASGPLAAGEGVPTSGDMLTVPLVAFVAFPVLFWAARGWRALMYVKKYPVPKNPTAAA